MTDSKLEGMVSALLRWGVLVSAAVVVAGGIYFLGRHGGDRIDYSHFQRQPVGAWRLEAIFSGIAGGHGRALIQLGILLLVATPVARVVLSLVGFALERDRVYVFVTALVLCILLFSLLSGLRSG